MGKLIMADIRQWWDQWDAQQVQLTKEEADYDPFGAIKNNGVEGCANCRWFIEPGACLVVQGEISPVGVSNMWTADVDADAPTVAVTVGENASNAGSSGTDNGSSIPKVITKLINRVKTVGDRQVRAHANPLVQASAASTGELTFTVREQPDGQLRFFCTPTNCFEDDHKTIFSTRSHEEYVKWADEREFAPELWVWHTPDTRFGQVDWMDVSEGFLVCSGIIDSGKEDLARSFDGSTGMSHGFLYADEKEGVIDKYWTYELSVLPRQYASNEPTAFNLLEGMNMAFKESKKAYLKDKLGVDEATIQGWEKNTETLRTSLEGMGIAWRSSDEDLPATVATEVTTPVAVVVPTESPAVAVEGITQLTSQVQDVMTAITALSGAMAGIKELAVSARDSAAQANQTLDERVANTMQSQISQLPVAAQASQRSDNIVATEDVTKKNEWLNSVLSNAQSAVQGI